MKSETEPMASIEQAPKSSSVRFVSGAAGSVITSLVVTPLDVVKVRQQNSVSTVPSTVEPCPRKCGALIHSSLKRTAPAVGASFSSASIAPGVPAMMREIVRTEGFGGLYAGIRPTLLMSVPNAAIYYTAYESIRDRLVVSTGKDNMWIPLVSGGAARWVASTVTAPLEYMRTAQASVTDASQRQGALRMMQSAIKQGGPTALFQGLGPTLWRDVPFSGIYWVGVEYLRSKQESQSVMSPQQVLVTEFVNGALAGLVAAAATTPFDVIKTRQQSVGSGAADACHHNGAQPYRQPLSTGTWAHLCAVAEQEGLAGLWRGGTARMLKVAPACGIMIGTYEFCTLLLSE